MLKFAKYGLLFYIWCMRSNISFVYVANLDNTTVVVDTSLMPFCNDLKKLEPEARDYHYFSRQFKKSNSISYEIDGKVYNLQKISVNVIPEAGDELANPK